MKIKELLVPFALAWFTVWAIQYFFNANIAVQSERDNTKSGQRVQAPNKLEVQVSKPLNTEIDFLDDKSSIKPLITVLETKHARYEFSNEGASLVRLSFIRSHNNVQEYFTTIFPPAMHEREQRSFLVALEEKVPYYFNLVSKEERDDCFVLTYSASFNNSVMVKTFTVYKKLHQIDLEISCKLSDGKVITPRIFIVSPLLSELMRTDDGTSVAQHDVISGIVNDNGGIKVVTKNQQMTDAYWAQPTLFGAQDRYFVHAMVGSNQSGVERGYYKVIDNNRVMFIIEGASITNSGSWKTKFYLGPKEDDAMQVVDPRLEETLNYGWFAFISKPLSKVILEILNFLRAYASSYGWAIIIVTILFKILLLPFTYGSEESNRKRMEMQKKLEYIQAKYKNDPEALAQARTELIRKYGVPGLGGCLPVLIQLPLFWALSIILANAIELYKAPFLWIPDLSVADPYYILPVIITLAIILHSPATADSKQRVSSIIIAIFVGALMSNLSAGLTLYIATSTLLGVLQSLAMKQLKQ